MPLSFPMMIGLLFSCFTVGFLGSLIGVGGGTFLIPVLVVFFKFTMAEAMPISLLCALASGLCGLYFSRHEQSQAKAVKKAFLFEPAAIFAAFIVTPWSYFLDPNVMMGLFSVFLLLISLVSYHKNSKQIYLPTDHPSKKNTSALGIFVSFLTGASSGLFGVGGGVLIVPLLSGFVGIALNEAITISLFIMISTSVIALTIHSTMGTVLWQVGLLGVLAVLPGSFLGSKIKRRIPIDFINRFFLFFAVSMSLMLLLESVLGVK